MQEWIINFGILCLISFISLGIGYGVAEKEYKSKLLDSINGSIALCMLSYEVFKILKEDNPENDDVKNNYETLEDALLNLQQIKFELESKK